MQRFRVFLELNFLPSIVVLILQCGYYKSICQISICDLLGCLELHVNGFFAFIKYIKI
jgi:uncharacterized membrane protein